MKMSRFTDARFLRALGLLGLVLGQISMAAEIPFIVEVKKDTPIFRDPSLKAPKLAEAEEGTLLLYLDRSKRGIWVKLRDVDGLEGWMPVERTDFKEVAAAASVAAHDNFASGPKIPRGLETERPEEKSREDMMKEILKEREAQSSELLGIRLAPVMKWLSDREPTTSRLGFRLDYQFGRVSEARNRNRILETWGAVEASFPSPLIDTGASDYSAALRYVGRTPIWGPFKYGPDLGYAIDKVKNDYRHHLSLGLSAGLHLGLFDLSLRGAYDFFANSNESIEVQLGVTF